MIPSPYYGGYDVDFVKRPGGVIVPVTRSSKTDFKLTLSALSEAHSKATSSGIKVKILLITNPDNPTGMVYTCDELLMAASFAKKHGLHLIINEMYFMSIHDPLSRGKHVSALTLSPADLPDEEHVHVVWGYSKTFGMSGFRIGCVITQSASLISALCQIAYFTAIGGLQQHHIGSMIADSAWVEWYVNETNLRLRHAYETTAAKLASLDIPYIDSKGGFFVWVNLSKFMTKLTRDDEISLFLHLVDHGIYIAPGAAFNHTEIGWFRIIFADTDAVLTEGFDRLGKGLASFKHKARL